MTAQVLLDFVQVHFKAIAEHIVLLLLALAVFAPASHAQELVWSAPYSLGPYWFPDIAVDASGQVHVVWSSGTEGYDLVLYASSPDGKMWRQPNDVAALPQVEVADSTAPGGIRRQGEATRPALVVDSEDELHMTYRGVDVFYAHADSANAAVATAWLPARQVTYSSSAYYSRPALDSSGVLHLVYTENVQSIECPECYQLYYRRSLDRGAGWSDPRTISSPLNGAAKPQVVVDGEDHLHVTWEAGEGGGLGQVLSPTSVLYSYSEDGGENWTQPFMLSEGPGSERNVEARNTALSYAGADTLLVAWLAVEEDQIYFRYSSDDGRSWSAAQPIPRVWGRWSVSPSRLDSYSMATDSVGNVHLIMVGRQSSEQQTLDLLHLAWDGKDWTAPEVIAAYEGDEPEWPRLAIGPADELHVAWFVRDEASVFDSDHGNYEVFYARSPATTSAAVGQPASSPLATATHVVRATAIVPTDVPQAPPENRVATGQVEQISDYFTELDDILLVAKALLPTVLLFLVVAGHRVTKERQRRRD